MSPTVCLCAHTLQFPRGGGHLWVYLNWALSLQAEGCRVIWLEGNPPPGSPLSLGRRIQSLKRRLERYGLADSVALWSPADRPLDATAYGCLPLEAAAGADLILNFR